MEYYWGQPGQPWPAGTTPGPGAETIEGGINWTGDLVRQADPIWQVLSGYGIGDEPTDVTIPPIPGLFPGILASPNTGLQPGDTGFLSGDARGPGRGVGHSQSEFPELFPDAGDFDQSSQALEYNQFLNRNEQMGYGPSRSMSPEEYARSQGWNFAGQPYQSPAQQPPAQQAQEESPLGWLDAAKNFVDDRNLTNWAEVVKGYGDREGHHEWDENLGTVRSGADHVYAPSMSGASAQGWVDRPEEVPGLQLDQGSYGPYDTTLRETMPRFLSQIERRQRRRQLGGREERRSANQAARDYAATQNGE